jgi:NAD(P)-dependent dehydrogenase (short-subunit alcohol dehydrogenase family)
MTGKACLVTGATSGIGKETAVGLARRGATVLVVARTVERGDAAAVEIRERVPAARVDVLGADLAQVRRLAGAVADRYDRLDALVNNAAELARRLAGTGVTANCLHPGFVRTALGRDVTGLIGAVVRLVLPFQPGPATAPASRCTWPARPRWPL